ncbi:MAG: sigma-70 family RNA polymerase sigma factor [Xanthomonadales bacterium]|nr:sigma-70 family RNA polymerase sigma factor [Xanthomonadales bacterium]
MSDAHITRLLLAWGDGDRSAFEQLVPLIYDDLLRIAHQQRRKVRVGETLNTTALVHEAFAKMVDQRNAEVRNRQHFFAIAARAMRQILVDAARGQFRAKRGAGVKALPFDDERLQTQSQAREIIAIDDALESLASLDEKLVRIVECRFFAGFTAQETAEILGTSVRTIQRDWQRARAWLKDEMSQ